MKSITGIPKGAEYIMAMDKVPLTAAVVVLQLNPNLRRQFHFFCQEENNSTTKWRRTNKDKTRNNELASSSWFLSNANEDLLLEIFLRLPNSRSAIQCSSVCRDWLQLISQPQFIPRFMRRRDHCYTILYRRSHLYACRPQEYYQVVCKLFSNESFLLHGKPPSSSNYLDFMSKLMSVRASCNDLLLVSPDQRANLRISPIPKFYICNPVTKKWSLIPGDTPDGHRIGFALICHQDQCKVVIIYSPNFFEAHPGVQERNYQTRVTVFCAKSGQWSESNFSFPTRDTKDYSFDLKVATCNGILYWMDGYQNLDRIIALDLFNKQRAVLIYLPEPIHSDVANVTVRLAAVKGGDELRLLHLFRAGGEDRKCFVAKVWELNRRDDDNSWVLVHERNLRVPNADDNNVVSAVFHPKDCDVIFVTCGMVVFEYRVLEDTCEKVGEIREPIGEECLDSFVLEHPAWPTVVPSF